MAEPDVMLIGGHGYLWQEICEPAAGSFTLGKPPGTGSLPCSS